MFVELNGGHFEPDPANVVAKAEVATLTIAARIREGVVRAVVAGESALHGRGVA